ncbi:MAG: toll/interleukin-1 receptor domain-containing protein [Ktedonobacteraceae bacterium]
MSVPPLMVSHTSRSGREWTHDFVHTLRIYGYDVWFDETDLPFGAPIADTLQKEISTRDILFILDQQAIHSTWVQHEVLIAAQQSRRIIPILKGHVQLEGLLKLRQAINVQDLNGMIAAQRVIGALNVLYYEAPSPTSEKTIRPFISHSNKDREFTLQVAESLRASGCIVWVDYVEITSGDFYERINKGLGQSNWMIFIVSPDSLSSPVVREEVNAAFGLKHTGDMQGLIPIVARAFDIQAMPPLWRNLHRIDATTTSFQMVMQQVFQALRNPTDH